MRGAVHPFSQYVFMAWCFVKHRDNFTFTLLFQHWYKYFIGYQSATHLNTLSHNKFFISFLITLSCRHSICEWISLYFTIFSL